MELNIFEVAARKKIRFTSSKGALSVEQVFDLPLTSRHGDNLDSLAVAVDEEIQALPKKSFVARKANTGHAELELKLALLTHIIGVKEAEESTRLAQAANAPEIAKLKELLGNKQSEALAALTPEEIKARLKALGAAGV